MTFCNVLYENFINLTFYIEILKYIKKYPCEENYGAIKFYMLGGSHYCRSLASLARK